MQEARIKGLVAGTTIVLLSLMVLPAHAEKLDYAISLGKPRDEAELIRKLDFLEVKIKSPGGIGNAKLRIRKEDVGWPESIVLLIRLSDGKPLKELEGFTIEGEKIRVMGSRRASGKMDAFERKAGEKDPADRPAPRKVNIKVVKTEAAMRIAIPGALLAGEREVRIQWIDFYR